jgi:hypothetical protein
LSLKPVKDITPEKPPLNKLSPEETKKDKIKEIYMMDEVEIDFSASDEEEDEKKEEEN